VVNTGSHLKKIDWECLLWVYLILDGNEKRILAKTAISLRAAQITEIYCLANGLFAFPERVSSWGLLLRTQTFALPGYYVDYFGSNLHITVKNNKLIKSNYACDIFRSSSTIFKH
jgi:hypothetical protein